MVTPSTKRGDLEAVKGEVCSVVSPRKRTKKGNLNVFRGVGSEWSHLEQRVAT